jgi:TolB-like protein/Tfp pilus assembly protein PilF
VDAATERQLWSNHYEADKRDILTMQREVARAVADEIKVKLTPSEHELLASAQSVNPAAYDAYLRGKELVRRSTRESCQTALTFFDQALDIDPDFALAHAGRANAYHQLASTHMHPADTLPAMKRAAEAALALDEDLPEAHIALGNYFMQYEWAWERAGQSFERALELNRNSAEARLAYADYLVAMKRTDEGMDQLNMARELSPAARYTEEDFGGVSFAARRFERTIRDSREALKVDPEFWHAHKWMGLAQGQLKQFADAVYHLRTAFDLSKSPTVRAMLGAVLALAGKPTEARAIRKELRNLPDALYVCPYEVATISIGLNEYDEAFDDMYQACDDRAACIPYLQVDPRLDPIRDDPRFDDLLRRVGFEPPPKPLSIAQQRRGQIRLAVLPFEDLSPDPQEWFSDGMTGELIATLGKIEALGVISRTSAMRYKNTDKPLPQIARELNVSKAVEGSVLRIGGRVRITVELIDAATDTHLWSNSYERDERDVITLQNEVARAIAGEIRVKLTPGEQQRLANTPSVNPAANEACLIGRHHWYKFTSQGYAKAREYFELAIKEDPGYAPAYAWLGNVYAVLGLYGSVPPKEALPKAKELMLKALEIDDALPVGHASLAMSLLFYDWDWDRAEKELKRAIELNPSYEDAHHWYSICLTIMGRHDEALREIELARALDPLSLAINSTVGRKHYFARRYDRAIEQLKKALELDEDYSTFHSELGKAYAQMGMLAEAIAEFQQTKGSEWAGYAHALAGNTDKAIAAVDRLKRRAEEEYVSPYRLALIYTGLGRKEEAFAALEQAYLDRSGLLVWLNVEPAFDPLRDDPRFDDLLRRVGFEPLSIPVEQTP